jgi:hypothetical protein
MATIRQYFETDFDYALRLKVKFDLEDLSYEGAVLYDATAQSAFIAFYFTSTSHTYDGFLNFLKALNYGSTGLNLEGGIVLPSAKQFPGQLRVENSNPLVIHYQLYGDPTWKNLLAIHTTRRVFIYSETDLAPPEIEIPQNGSKCHGPRSPIPIRCLCSGPR